MWLGWVRHVLVVTCPTNVQTWHVCWCLLLCIFAAVF